MEKRLAPIVLQRKVGNFGCRHPGAVDQRPCKLDKIRADQVGVESTLRQRDRQSTMSIKVIHIVEPHSRLHVFEQQVDSRITFASNYR
eukprot:1019277-Amphidinium_carterae.1